MTLYLKEEHLKGKEQISPSICLKIMDTPKVIFENLDNFQLFRIISPIMRKINITILRKQRC